MTCRAPDANDEQKSSPPIGLGSASGGPLDALLVPLGEALQILIHAQAQQAAQLEALAGALENLSAAIRELIASDIAGGDNDSTPEFDLEGKRIPRR